MQPSRSVVLVVDDDLAVRDYLCELLAHEGYAVESAADGAAGLARIAAGGVDLVLLDMILPALDGIELCRQVRARESDVYLPIIMLTALDDEANRRAGFAAGADDYVAKPFRIEEVLARVRALIRRSRGLAQPVLSRGRISLDPRLASVSLAGQPVRLTAHEFRVLSYLMHHADRVIPAGELTEHIYAHDHDRDSNTVEVFIARLRRKLGADAIQTVRGLGYRMGS
jgi:two-component system OmpR family response regulator